MSTLSASIPLLRLAEQPSLVVSREQALSLGLGRHTLDRMARSGLWPPLGRGIFHTVPSAPSWLGLAWAGVLIDGDDARLGGDAVAHLRRSRGRSRCSCRGTAVPATSIRES